MENSQIQTIDGKRRVSVTFERKKDLGDYQNVVARAWVEDEVPSEATDQAVAETLVDLLNVAKVAVYDTLGIEVLKDDTGVIREAHEPVVTVTDAKNKIGAQMPGAETFQTGGLKVMNPDKLTEDVPQYIIDKCNEKGIEAIWVNHGKFGAFYKEAVKQGEAPKIPDGRDPSKAGIIKSDS